MAEQVFTPEQERRIKLIVAEALVSFGSGLSAGFRVGGSQDAEKPFADILQDSLEAANKQARKDWLAFKEWFGERLPENSPLEPPGITPEEGLLASAYNVVVARHWGDEEYLNKVINSLCRWAERYDLERHDDARRLGITIKGQIAAQEKQKPPE